jgi:hypothetical protein
MIPIPPQVLIKLGAQILPQVIGAGFSYSQAAAQRKKMEEAESEAAKAIAAARAKLEEAPFERLQVPTEAYENALQNITAQSMQFTEAAREAGARELAASVGRLGAAGLKATEREREAMAQNIFNRDVAVAKDEAIRLSKLAQLDATEASGAQLAAAQADARRGAALQSATSSLADAASTVFGELPLYMLSPEAMQQIRDKNKLFGKKGTFTPDLQMERRQIASELGALQDELFYLENQFQPLSSNG